MNNTIEQIRELLHEAAELHHRVYRIVDGNDANWALWYAHWLITLSELPQLLHVTPTEAELTYLLVKLDKEYTAEKRDIIWETYYAQELINYYEKV